MSQNEEARPPDPSPAPAIERLQLLAMIGMGAHYMSHGSADGTYPAVCRAAVITQTFSLDSGAVGLCVLNPTGLFFHESVQYDPAGGPGTWHWPERV